jgi:hypothetical protein
MGSLLKETCPLGISKNANDAGCGAVFIVQERVSGMTGEHSQGIAVDINVAAGHFSTELLHPKLRSSVRRISVPSQTAEVSS